MDNEIRTVHEEMNITRKVMLFIHEEFSRPSRKTTPVSHEYVMKFLKEDDTFVKRCINHMIAHVKEARVYMGMIKIMFNVTSLK